MAIASMKDALTRVKSELLDYRMTKLKRVGSQIKKGIFSASEVFPAIALMPEYEELGPSQSGGQYSCNRGITIEVWTHRYDVQKSQEMTLEIVEHVKDILQASAKLDGDLFDIAYGDITFGAEPPQKATFLQRCILPVVLRSYETQPANRKPLRAAALKELTAKSLTDQIFEAFQKTHRKRLTHIKSFRNFGEPPVPTDRELALVVNTEKQEHAWGHRDGVTRSFELLYWTYLFGKEVSLDANLDMIETLKDICQEEFRWNGWCLWSWMPRIDYGVYVADDKFLYSSSLKLDCMCKENL